MARSDYPLVPLPDPGEGGPLPGFPEDGGPTPPDGGETPVIPLPNPGEGGAVPTYPGNWLPGLIRPVGAQVRVLNAAFGYPALRVLTGRRVGTGLMNYGALSGYRPVSAGYRTVTAMGGDGYVYIQKSLPFRSGGRYTVAVVNRPGGLDLLEISDLNCRPGEGWADIRLCNLAYRSRPTDMLLPDGRTVYTDVGFKQTTAFKRIRPGSYEFFFADTDQQEMPAYADIETLDSGFMGTAPLPEGTASLTLRTEAGRTYTVFLLSGESGRMTAAAAED